MALDDPQARVAATQADFDLRALPLVTDLTVSSLIPKNAKLTPDEVVLGGAVDGDHVASESGTNGFFVSDRGGVWDRLKWDVTIDDQLYQG